uniref:Bromo domain-containing protein n=1 Tax=Zea mays TaxID=4577 RepID=C0PMV0_MAIZE|nr:unknown [Zea mays]
MIRRHMDFRMLHSKIKSGAISGTKELLRDILIFINNVITFYPKTTLEHMAAVELRDFACTLGMQGQARFLQGMLLPRKGMARDLAVMSWLIKRLQREMSQPRRGVWVGLQRVGRGLLGHRKIAPSKAGKVALGHR